MKDVHFWLSAFAGHASNPHHTSLFAGWSSPCKRKQAEIIRDIFGNPFRPVAFDPSWRTTDAVALASSMYESRDFASMPILADALQDAGCNLPEILDHCRGPVLHVRGCWVVDLVLDRCY